ncbi:MAG: ammonium transporter [Candidatus Tectimicrobiota bacterium]|nr:MAG: ammonium transporter [Candidatus Tectomicrobia bacterium]
MPVSRVPLLSALLLAALPLLGWAAEAPTAADNAKAIAQVQTHANYLWTLVAAFLVFFMQPGFAMVETGFTRAKNACNILMKNLLDFSIGSLAFWAVGFGLMFGASNGWIGTSGFFFSDFARDQDPWVFAFWMFQVVFAGTAATICSGAMAERTKFLGYVIYAVLVSAVIYPIFGSWAWGSLYKGGGWLEQLGFIDFAGSTVVHSIGAWVALAGAVVLGPRLGKYGRDGKPQPIPGHNLPLAALGVFILWFGWFGFNPGSTTTADTSIARIAVNTNLAAAAGAVATMLVTWLRFKAPDVGLTLNGALAGLVAITAPCNNVSPTSAVIIGALAGVLVVYAVLFFERRGVDDPVGAVSVHGVCGAWGTLAVALFNETGFTWVALGVQALGVVVAFVWAFGLGYLVFKLIAATVGLRVSPEEELEGLDLAEHRAQAYPDFALVHPAGAGGLQGSSQGLPIDVRPRQNA